ncbi:MAG TPA: NADPH-dependent oxidoreductase [Erysipelotrichaceae bacterium]|nr:NADPH-dependent oxidoreductase [Erysipelotrichaceae bacterium]
MNSTIQNQLNHRSIRKFKDIPLTPDQINLLVDVARHTSTSSFMQSYSILSITDPEKKAKVAQIGNQNYIAECGHLFIMLADQHRNQLIAEEQDTDTEVLGSFDRFFVAATDAILAAQNIMIAAEAMGLGAVFLGSILNQVDQLIEIFNLPEHVVPVLGIAIGHPDQAPQLKPRLPRDIMHFENTYPKLENVCEALKDYDAIVHEYYDLRDANNRVDAFTTQIAKGMTRKHPGRMQLLKFYQGQGFIKY